MTDHELELRLRAWYRAEVSEQEAAPSTLRRSVAGIPATASPRNSWWSARRLRMTLLAAATLLLLGGAIAVGSGLVRLPSVVLLPSSTLSPVFPSATPTQLAPRAATWIATRQMAEPRAFHTATLLPDGRVLVVGGLSANSTPGSGTTSAELFDAGTASWTITGSMATSRESHTATLLLNGKVLVAGGYKDYQALASAELFDPASGSWTPTGGMIEARGAHTATLLPDGKVLVAGGRDKSSSTGHALVSAELYDPSTGKWTATGPLIKAHTAHVAALLPDGKVLLVGASYSGLGGLDNTAAAELYDPGAGSWSATGTMATTADYQTATLLSNGKVLLAGGIGLVAVGCCNTTGTHAFDVAESYDPGSGTWTATGSMVAARYQHAAVALADGKVLVVGGVSPNAPVASAELYDPGTGSWSATQSAGTARASCTATLLLDGRVLVVGGLSIDHSPLASVEMYDPGTGN